MIWRHVLPGLVALVLVLSACAQTYRLPTLENEDGWCRGIGYGGKLRGDPADPRVAWGESETRTNALIIRQELVWPIGYTARFSPELEVLDASGSVRYRAGDTIAGGCTTGPNASGPMYVIEE